MGINDKNNNSKKIYEVNHKILNLINHNLNFLEHGQGGLLDILFKKFCLYHLILKIEVIGKQVLQ